jgi:hypothetical protein
VVLVVFGLCAVAGVGYIALSLFAPSSHCAGGYVTPMSQEMCALLDSSLSIGISLLGIVVLGVGLVSFFCRRR